MQSPLSRRAGARLAAWLSSPTCSAPPRTVCHRAAISARRPFSTTPHRLQDEQAQANAQKVSNELSASDESEPLRDLTDGLLDEAPILDADGKHVDWTRSFQGLSTEPFTEHQSQILQQELNYDDIEIKPDGIVYLPEIKYRRILNKAFGPGGWGLAPRGETIVTGKIVTREYGLVCNGRYVASIPLSSSDDHGI